MPLGFTNPWMLAAGSAAALPVLIHMFSRRRLRRVPFATLRFLQLAHNRLVRRHRLRQWLLLLLRMAAVALLALFVAHPVFSRHRDFLEIARQSDALVVILDNSLSMGYTEGNETRLERGRALLEAFLQRLGPGHRIALLATDPPAEPGPPEVLGDTREALADLKEIPLSYGVADIQGTMERAYGLLSPGRVRGKRAILIVTDLGRSGWGAFNPGALSGVDPDVPVTLIDLSGGKSAPNRSVERVDPPADQVIPGEPARIRAVVANFSDREEKAVPVSLWLGTRKVAEQLVDLGAGERRTVNFSFVAPSSGPQEGKVELAPDRLTADDRFYFPLQVEPQIRVLVVDGDPRPSLSESESYYLANALHPEGAGTGGPIAPRVIPPQELNGANLKEYQAVILANVDGLSPQARRSLFRYVWEGGGVFFFLGDKVEAQRYNREFFSGSTPLLPLPLAGIKTADEKKPALVSRLDEGSPVVRIFRELGPEAFRTAHFYRYFTVGTAKTAGRPLLTLAGGDPLLLAKSVGRGKVLLFTSSADLDWNDLPAKVAYLPLLQQAVFWLAGRLGNPGIRTLSWGTRQEVDLPAGLAGREARLREPGGGSLPLPIERRADKSVLILQPHQRPGIYRLQLPDGTERRYGVNPPAAESDLAPADLSQLRQKAGAVPIERIAAPAGRTGILLESREVDTSPWFLLVLGGVLAAEAFVAHRE